MKQQINLYRSLYPQKKYWPFSKKVSTIAGLLFVLVVGLLGTTSWKIYELKQQYQFELSAKSIKETTFNNMKKEANNSIQKDKQNAELAALKAEFKNKISLKEQLDQQVAESATGYLNHFVALARQDIRGIWLNKVYLSNNEEEGNVVTLAGETNKPALIAKYLDRLSREKPFKGLDFVEMQVNKTMDKEKNEGNKATSFIVSTESLDDLPNNQRSSFKQ